MSETIQLTAARPVAQSSVQARATFILRTYTHLFGALIAFTLIEVALFSTGAAESIVRVVAGTSWLLVLGAFMVVGWLASRTAARARSMAAQYAALAAYVVAEALIFVPLLWVAFSYAPGAVQSAAMVSAIGFAGLTVIAFTVRKDFSFLRSILMWCGVGALLLIVASVLFGFEMGTWFSVGMIVFAGAAILYDTSNVMRHYPEDRYVSAALQLFASVALLFWYVLRLMMALQRD
jgi:hypothetical protein